MAFKAMALNNSYGLYSMAYRVGAYIQVWLIQVWHIYNNGPTCMYLDMCTGGKPGPGAHIVMVLYSYGLCSYGTGGTPNPEAPAP